MLLQWWDWVTSCKPQWRHQFDVAHLSSSTNVTVITLQASPGRSQSIIVMWRLNNWYSWFTEYHQYQAISQLFLPVCLTWRRHIDWDRNQTGLVFLSIFLQTLIFKTKLKYLWAVRDVIILVRIVFNVIYNCQSFCTPGRKAFTSYSRHSDTASNWI